MSASGFGVYIGPKTVSLSKPAHEISFVGHSIPHFSRVRAELAKRLAHFQHLPLQKADWEVFHSVHSLAYLEALHEL